MAISPVITVKFFDESVKALNRIDKKTRRVMIRTGAFGRVVVRRMIKRRKKPSPPGHPPHAHAPGAQGMKDVRFAVNNRGDTVAIGHIKYDTVFAPKFFRGVTTVQTSRKPVPQLLNEGGRAQLEVRGPRGTKNVPLNYRPRPFRDKAFAVTANFLRGLLEKEPL